MPIPNVNLKKKQSEGVRCMNKPKLLAGFLLLLGMALWCLSVSPSGAAHLESKDGAAGEVRPYRLAKSAAELPNAQQRVHRVGLIQLCVTNWGFFGSQTRDLKESLGGCFNPNPDEEVEAPSCEYPPGSDIDYLFQGGLWIGAMVDDYPYTTVACDGWQWIYEMWPEAGDEGAIKERTIRPNSACYSTDAVSEQDIIAVYTDTSADIPLSPWKPETDDFDNRKHFPLGLQITQKSYSWSYEYAEDFVLLDFWIKNIGVKRVQKMYMGLYIDADCGHKDENPYGNYGAQDDICGFRGVVGDPGAEVDCSDTVNIAWIADNDGHGVGGEKAFTNVSPIHVSGVRVVRSPKALDYSFNWFISNTGGYPKDWGPWKRQNVGKWIDFNICYPEVKNTFPDGVLGTPGGDCSKYFMLSNEEFDYDQIFSCTRPDADPDWLEASPECEDLADGYDTRYLLSFGPFDQIAPGESLVVTIGYIVGADFHREWDNWLKHKTPEEVYAGFDFADFETNAKWAAFVYDNPVVPDFPCGDGIPDFKGPPPPPPPTFSPDTGDVPVAGRMWFETSRGRVKVRWNGKTTELSRDSFSDRKDFEGYRVYRSRTGAVEDYALLGSYDKIDYKIYKLNRDKVSRPWEWRAASVSLDSLRSWLDQRGKDGIKIGDDPTEWTKFDPFVIDEVYPSFYIRLSDSVDADLGYAVAYDSIELETHDSLYFEAQDWNMGFDDIISHPAYRDSVDLGLVSDTADRYWDYEFELSEFASQSVYYAVTAFDVGHPQSNLQPLESSKLVNATEVWPVDSWDKVEAEGLNVMVYPNPYRIDGKYVDNKYEPGGIYGKRIRFVNLPPRCTIRIYSLDGDLIQTLYHEKDENDLDATTDSWNLISRNSQAVVSGIYLFSVEDKDTGENQVGKFVIMK
jgi:hypothetical protein